MRFPKTHGLYIIHVLITLCSPPRRPCNHARSQISARFIIICSKSISYESKRTKLFLIQGSDHFKTNSMIYNIESLKVQHII